jgi:hypothetical protein
MDAGLLVGRLSLGGALRRAFPSGVCADARA